MKGGKEKGKKNESVTGRNRRTCKKERKKERKKETKNRKEHTKLRVRRQNDMNQQCIKAAAALQSKILLRGSLRNLHLCERAYLRYELTH